MQDVLFIFQIPLDVYPGYLAALQQFFQVGFVMALSYFLVATGVLAVALYRLSKRPRTFGRVFLQCWLVAVVFLPGAAFSGGFQVGPLALVLLHSIVSAEFAAILGNVGFLVTASLIAWVAALLVQLLGRRRHVV
jgi:hypothetical protein